MKKRFTTLVGAAAFVAGSLSIASLPAQTLTFQPTAPVPTNTEFFNFTGGADDSNNVSDGSAQVDGAGNDGFTYVANNRTSMGQTFTTGSDSGGYRVTAIWIRHCGYTNDPALTYWSFAAGSAETFRITDPAQTNTAGFAVDTETYTITGAEPNNPGGFNFSTTGTGLWLRFGLANTNVILLPNKQYGFDITGIGGDFFETWGTSNDVYSGGTAYAGSTGGAVDDTLVPLVGDRAFLVEINGGSFAPPPIIQPTITNQPANVMVPMGANAVFAPAYSGTLPFAYQWYFNTNTLLIGETNATLVVAGATTNQVGTYSVIVTNDSGGATSSVARLSVILPSVTTNINFSAGSGSILDMNGVSTPFSVRLGGTGLSIPTEDPDLLMNNGAMDFTSVTCDFNGQLLVTNADAIGFDLSSIGFTGTQDLAVTGSITNVAASVNYDQAGIFAGATTTNFVRAGLIFNSDFTANPGSYGVGNLNGGDIGIATAPPPPADMLVTIARAGGVWSASVNGVNVTPNASLAFLNATNDLTVGVFTIDTSGTHNTCTVNGFSASLFTGPKLTLAPVGGNLKFTWNVIGAGLQSNPNLSNPAGWTPVAGASASPYSIPTPTSGSMFYRIAQ
jgi:regulation of enolase protein 1 (concanavalin A-like superfamily)